MAINVSVQYNGGLLPDIILLIQCYFRRGTRCWGMLRRSRCVLILYLRGLNRRSTACFFSSLDRAARSGARVQHLPKLKAVLRYGSARIYY